MKIYHGSLNHVKNPNVEKGRQKTDFSKGFYTTTNIKQATRWALDKKKNKRGNSKAIVNVYEFNEDLLSDEKYDVKKFDEPNVEWLSFVVSCRNSNPHDYDIVYGPVANDNIYLTITLFESGVLSAEETVARLKVNEYYNQISFHSRKSVENLTFLESFEV